MISPSPKDAAAVILLRPNTDPKNPEVFCVKRSTKLAFLGGYRAFPGGQREANDSEINVANCAEPERAAMISCAASEGYSAWERSEIIVVPPVLHALKALAGGLTNDLVERFLSVPEARGEPTRRIEFHPNYICFPVRTPTRPPATHTNCYLIYTSREILVIDPGSPYEDEQQALTDCIDDLVTTGKTVREIVLTHVHPDHVAGVNALNDQLEQRQGARVPVAAHPFTAESLKNEVKVDRQIEDDDVLELKG